MASEPAPGHPEIVRVRADNPGPMTLTGTNSYVVATDDGAHVIDPGPDDPGHLDAIRAVAEPHGGITGVLLTHSHSDHTAGVKSLGAPLLWGKVSPADEGQALAAALTGQRPGGGGEGGTHPRGEPSPQGMGGPLPRQDPPAAGPPTDSTRAGPFEVVPTPGHAADHVCFVLGDVCFCGDLILGEGSSIVPPAAGGGSLADYMRSLELVRQLDAELLAPGHGPWITDPPGKIAEYVEHRLSRERRLVAALESGERSRAALLARVWDDVPEPLRPAAAFAMQAHLEKLAAEGLPGADGLRD